MSGLSRLKRMLKAQRKPKPTGVHALSPLQAMELCGSSVEVMATEDLVWPGRHRSGTGLVYGCFSREKLARTLERFARIEVDYDDKDWPLRAYERGKVTLRARVRT